MILLNNVREGKAFLTITQTLRGIEEKIGGCGHGYISAENSDAVKTTRHRATQQMTEEP